MGGESTSDRACDKAQGTNSPRPQVEVKDYEGELTVTADFAGLLM
jgi:hypothetical protein